MNNELFLVVTLAALATISPGADFAVVTRNSLQYSKKTGYMTALGVASATWIHTFYCITGIALIIANTPSLFNAIKYCGAAYLFYLGFKSFFSRATVREHDSNGLKKNNPVLGLKQGFLSNATNPKTTLFFLSLFTMVINSTTPLNIQIFYGFIIFLLHLCWFAFVCYLINHPLVAKKFDIIEKYLTKLIGFALIMISLRIIMEIIK